MPETGANHQGKRTRVIDAGVRLGLAMALCLLSGTACAQYQWVTDLEAGVFRNSNLGDGAANPDIHAVTGLTQAVSTGPFFELQPGTNLTLTGELRNTAFNRYTAEDNYSLGFKALLDNKFGLGREAPHAYAVASETALHFRDDLRSGHLQALTVGTRSRFGDRVALHAEAGIDRRWGQDAPALRPGLPGNVFDQFARRLTVGGDYRLAESLLLQMETTLRRGDADYIETTDPGDAFTGATAVARDPTFGPGVFVEKVPVRALMLDLRLSWALGDHASLNLALRRQLTLDITGTLYTRSVPALTYQYRFD